MKSDEVFQEKYKALNQRQKEAVGAIEGPVMVVAGPGTGKTEILALRIANILKETDTKADSILCLTFTNAAVKTMRDRLRRYIGKEASNVKVSTFHSFAMELVEKYFAVLGFDYVPKLMDDKDTIATFDAILEEGKWEHIRSKSEAGRYFGDLKSLITFLKKEGVSAEEFQKESRAEIERIKADPASISSRGPSKGQLKKEALQRLDSLERSIEAGKFYEAYESFKVGHALLDYDDLLVSLLKIVKDSEDVSASIKENYLYVLVDEHQDSSRIQNEFLEILWGKVESPNIFVVGDDRQLIYGFAGASLDYFKSFSQVFKGARLISLTENYRSTSSILEAAHELLQSSISHESLRSNKEESYKLGLFECAYPRDEIILAGISIKKMISSGLNPSEIAILLPKNKQVRSAVAILRGMGITVASEGSLNLFDVKDASAFIRVLKIISNPGNANAFAESLLDSSANVPAIATHKYMSQRSARSLTFLHVLEDDKAPEEIKSWVAKIKSWIEALPDLGLYSLIQLVGKELLLDSASDGKELLLRVEIVRTVLHLATVEIEKNPKCSLKGFLDFLVRLESYREHVPLAVFGRDEGVKVLTMHDSKGREFDFVWVAHADNKSLEGGAQRGFALPESLAERRQEKDELALRRQLYVAITRAKRFCNISYALHSESGVDQRLASVLEDLDENHFERASASETEKQILAHDPRAFVISEEKSESLSMDDIKDLVSEKYTDIRVSASLLNHFYECPWKWYFLSVLHLPEPKTESLAFGDIVHVSIDKILKLSKKPSKSEIKKIVDEVSEASTYGTELKRSRMAEEALGIVSSWVDERVKSISQNRENESLISIHDERFPELTIFGKVDLIEHLDETSVKVTDFKTGNPRLEKDLLKLDEENRMSDYMRQLAMYSYLISSRSKGRVDSIECVLEFVQADLAQRFLSAKIDGEKINSLLKDIEDYKDFVKTGKWAMRECHIKSYGRQKEPCKYCALKDSIFK